MNIDSADINILLKADGPGKNNSPIFTTMNRVFSIIIIICIILGVIGCTKRNTFYDQLEHVSMLVESEPDSAKAILDKINPSTIKTSKERNKYYVLLAQVQDKCNLEINDSILSAAEYFDGSSQSRLDMLAKYYAGVYVLYQKTHSDAHAIIYFTDALSIAEALGENKYGGLINRGLAIVYQRAYDGQNEIKHFKKSLDCFVKSGLQIHQDYAILDLSTGFLNNEYWDESVAEARKSYSRGVSSSDPYLISESCRILGRAFTQLDQPDSTIYYLKLLVMNYPEYTQTDDFTFLSHAYFLSGDMLEAKAYLSMNDNPGTDGWYRSKLLVQEKRYKEAYESLYRQYERDNSIIRDKIKQSVTTSLEDHFNALNKKKTYQLLKSRNQVLFTSLIASILLIIVSIIFGFVFYRKEKQKRTIERDLLSLKESLSQLPQENKELNKRLRNILKSRLSIIDNILYSYHISDHTAENKEQRRISRVKMFKEATAVISDCKNTKSALYLEMEGLVNQHLDNLLSDFKSTFPNRSDEDYMLMTYSALGFTTNSLCLFLNADPKSIYNRRTRLKRRILESSCDRKADFLSILESV